MTFSQNCLVLSASAVWTSYKTRERSKINTFW